MRFSDRIGPVLPPWRAKVKLCVVALFTIGALGWISRSNVASGFWLSLVARRDALAGSLLSVNASLLGFSITSFSVLLSVRKDEQFAKLQKFENASRQMWGALISASWATGVGAITALLVIVLKGPNLADWFQSVLAAALFITTFYVILTFVGVVAVVQALVLILRPVHISKPSAPQPPETAFQTLGPPSED